MSYGLNSLRGVIYRIIYGTTTGVIKGDTRSLDYSSYDFNRVGRLMGQDYPWTSSKRGLNAEVA